MSCGATGAPGLNARSNIGVENVARSFHAPREPQQSTRWGRPHGKTFSRSKHGPCLMRLPCSVMGNACALTAATSLKLTRRGSCRTRGGRISESIRNRRAAVGPFFVATLRAVASWLFFRVGSFQPWMLFTLVPTRSWR
jgi:hypothetical protein